MTSQVASSQTATPSSTAEQILADVVGIRILVSSEVLEAVRGLDPYPEVCNVPDYGQVSSNDTKLRRPIGKIQVYPQIERFDVSIRDDLSAQYMAPT